jgi:hypothetical protein
VSKPKLFVPHTGGQDEVATSEARFIALRAGRRWGKTEVAASKAINAALGEDQMVWWVSNSADNVKRGYRKVLQYLPSSLLAKPAPSEGANSKVLHLVTGSRIEFYTAGSAGSAESSGKDSSALTGEGVDYLVVDEAALIAEMVWYQHLRPTLSDTGGRALFISTPRGRNWFWKMWKRGQLPGKDYASFHFTSYDNPYIPDSEIDDAREDLPEIMFRQEYLAEFVSNAASIFTVDEENIVAGLAAPYGHLVGGLDLAKQADWTVLDIARGHDRRPVLLERWQKRSWPSTMRKVIDEIRDLEAMGDVDGVTLMVDSTGLGDVVFDTLDEAGLDVIDVNFGSGRQKELMVRQLAADLEKHEAYILEEQREEHESYEYRLTPTGRYQFEAATGHDDYVAAKMLQNWGIVHEAPPTATVLSSDIPDEGEDEEEWDFDDGTTKVGTATPDPINELLWRDSAWS